MIIAQYFANTANNTFVIFRRYILATNNHINAQIVSLGYEIGDIGIEKV